MQGLGFLPIWNSRISNALDVSGDGSTIVGYSTASGDSDAFRWTSGGGMQGLGYLPGGSSATTAQGVSGDGTVIVGDVPSALAYEAFRWTAATGMQGLGDPGGGLGSAANAISADGSTIVGWRNVTFDGESYFTSEAFRWTSSGGMQDLGLLAPAPNSSSGASAVSGDGSVIVGNAWGDLDGDPRTSEFKPFIWDAAHGMRDLRQVLENEVGLNLTGWTLTDVAGISADGRTIVGNGTNPIRLRRRLDRSGARAGVARMVRFWRAAHGPSTQLQ